MEMVLRSILLMIFTVLLWAASAFADPMLTWNQPWQIIFPPGFTGIAVFEGEHNEGGTDIVSSVDNPKSSISWSSLSLVNAAMLSATRRFTLSNSPNGWNANLTGVLTGSLNPGQLNAIGVPQPITTQTSSSAVATLGIDITFLQLRIAATNDTISAPTPVPTVQESEAKRLSFLLADGQHTASIQFSGGGSSFVAFGNASFEPNITITAIPEPATWLLLGSGLIGLVLWRR